MTDYGTQAVLVSTTYTRQDQAVRFAELFLLGYPNKQTRSTYGVGLRQWFEFCASHGFDPINPSRPHIEAYGRMTELHGRSPATVAHKLNVLSAFFKYLLREEYIEKDPMIHIKRPNVERRSSSSCFTRGEVVDMIAASAKSSPQVHTLISLLAYHGLRISEALNIDIEHVVDVKGQSAVEITRKGGGHQHIVLANDVSWALRGLLVSRGATGPLFQTRSGRRMDRKTAGRIVKEVAEMAGVTKRAHPHAFRKTMATLSRNAGIPDREIIAAAGWRTPAMLAYYDGGKETLQANHAHSLAVFYDRAA